MAKKNKKANKINNSNTKNNSKKERRPFLTYVAFIFNSILIIYLVFYNIRLSTQLDIERSAKDMVMYLEENNQIILQDEAEKIIVQYHEEHQILETNPVIRKILREYLENNNVLTLSDRLKELTKAFSQASIGIVFGILATILGFCALTENPRKMGDKEKDNLARLISATISFVILNFVMLTVSYLEYEIIPIYNLLLFGGFLSLLIICWSTIKLIKQ